ncbi:MAG TPA: hypothetical protein VGF79_14560 [Bacteroidia bacterium]
MNCTPRKAFVGLGKAMPDKHQNGERQFMMENEKLRLENKKF